MTRQVYLPSLLVSGSGVSLGLLDGFRAFVGDGLFTPFPTSTATSLWVIDVLLSGCRLVIKRARLQNCAKTTCGVNSPSASL